MPSVFFVVSVVNSLKQKGCGDRVSTLPLVTVQ